MRRIFGLFATVNQMCRVCAVGEALRGTCEKARTGATELDVALLRRWRQTRNACRRVSYFAYTGHALLDLASG